MLIFRSHGSIKPPLTDISPTTSLCLTNAIHAGQECNGAPLDTPPAPPYAQDMSDDKNGVKGGSGIDLDQATGAPDDQ